MIKRAKQICVLTMLAFLLLPATESFAAQARRSAPKAQPQAAPAQPAGPKVVILPFQINAGPDQDRLNDELPAMLEQRLAARGIAVVPEREASARMRRDRITTLDLSTARTLAKNLGATAAVYGSYSQVGNAFSIDARYVELGEDGLVRPMFVEKDDAIELLPAVDELATRINNEVKRREMIGGVEVRGTRVLDPDVVLMRVNTRKGDAVDVNAIDLELKRIWDLGYFSDVNAAIEPRPEGLYLVYTVQEKPRIESIVVEGNSDIDAEDIIAAMSTRTGSVLNEKLLAEDLGKIREVFRKEGYYLGTVEHRIDTRQGGSSAALVLTVNEGNKLYIKAVRVEGAKEVSESDVKGELFLSERGWFSWITGSGILREEMLDRDSAAIGSYYMNQGYMDIAVGAPKVDYAEDGITVTFPISEGSRYRLGEIKYSGDLIDTDDALRNVTLLDDIAKDNGFFSLSTMQEDTKSLTSFYAEYGYAFAEVNAIPEKRGDEDHVVDITYEVQKKQKVYIRRAVIEGNFRTRDNVILRELRLTDGDMFVGSKLQQSIRRLNRLDFFENAESELVPTGKDEEVDLKIKVKEKSTGAIMGGFGYSTYSQFGVTGTIMEKNLFGKGYYAGFQAYFSDRYTSYQLTFANPRVNDTDLAISFDLYNTEQDYYDYEKDTTGGRIRFGYPIGEYTTLGWGYRLDRYRLYDFDDEASQIIKEYDGRRWSSVGSLSIARNTTDRYQPTTGTINRLAFDYGGNFFGGDDDFMAFTAEHQTYYELRQHHILHMRLKGGVVFENGSDEIPVFERFWMGGMDSVRGYRARDIVPRDPRTGDRIGGTRMAFANFEYLWTIAPQLGVNIVPFFDIGVNVDADHSYEWDDEIFRSVGMELRWRSPMGDLRFAYGFPLDEDRKGNRDGRFEFSVGQFF
ncbi:outer membrane protein assembly factor BamA [Desulfovibrio sp. OttesenSCG-928-O18]|nr:outer membrane protein assembly factor BamA [Desulfovibrio sp. OttesenSCG-928-O18]